MPRRKGGQHTLTYADVCLRVLTKGGQYSPLDRRLVWACVQTRGKVCLKGVRNWTQTDRYGTSQQYMRCWSELVWLTTQVYLISINPSSRDTIIPLSVRTLPSIRKRPKWLVYIRLRTPCSLADMNTRTPTTWQEPTQVIQAIIQGSTKNVALKKLEFVFCHWFEW